MHKYILRYAHTYYNNAVLDYVIVTSPPSSQGLLLASHRHHWTITMATAPSTAAAAPVCRRASSPITNRTTSPRAGHQRGPSTLLADRQRKHRDRRSIR